MPAYDYRCMSCGTRFEQKLSFSDNPDTVRCPHCGGVTQRIFAPPAVIFKGHGFYVTDNRTSNKKKTAENSER